jgi:hypothetical protein
MPRPTPSRSLRHLVLVALLPFAAGCDQLAELLELPNPSKVEAEGRAVGSACRHAGRSLEDCYSLNPAAAKAAVFAGWRDMNDYMMEHKLEVVPSQLVPGTPPAAAARTTPPNAGTPAAAAAH